MPPELLRTGTDSAGVQTPSGRRNRCPPSAATSAPYRSVRSTAPGGRTGGKLQPERPPLQRVTAPLRVGRELVSRVPPQPVEADRAHLKSQARLWGVIVARGALEATSLRVARNPTEALSCGPKTSVNAARQGRSGLRDRSLRDDGISNQGLTVLSSHDG